VYTSSVLRGAPYAFFLYIKFHLLIKKKHFKCFKSTLRRIYDAFFGESWWDPLFVSYAFGALVTKLLSQIYDDTVFFLFLNKSRVPKVILHDLAFVEGKTLFYFAREL
jgi:hypothetical protein